VQLHGQCRGRAEENQFVGVRASTVGPPLPWRQVIEAAMVFDESTVVPPEAPPLPPVSGADKRPNSWIP
jgi:hypothetical protein